MRLASIQMFRGIAALMIFVFHLAVTLDRYSAFKLRPYVQNLTLGVDLFFLISGFVMAHSVRNLSGPSSAIDFMARRIWRIVPLLYIVTAACILGMLLRGQFVEPARLFNGLTVIPLFPTASRYQFALIPAWSLAYEMAFYLLVTAAVALRLNRLALVVIVLPFTLRFPLMAEFALGVFLYEVWTLFPNFAKASLEWSPSSRAGKALLWLGTISYSLYLTHVVTFDALAPMLSPLGRAGMALVMAPLGLIAAALTYGWIEAPLQRMKHHERGNSAVGAVNVSV